MTELEKLELKRTEMRLEIDRLRHQQVQIKSLIPVVIRLSIMLADCDKMIADARVSDVQKKRITWK